MRTEQRRYVDIMALSAFASLMRSNDPVGVIRTTIESAMNDQSIAIESAVQRRMPLAAHDWFEKSGKRAIREARPAFPLSDGTIVSSERGLRFTIGEPSDPLAFLDEDYDEAYQ